MNKIITLAQAMSGHELKKERDRATSGVYGLFDTREPGRIRYVGSSETIEYRLYSHWHSTTNGRLGTPRSAWIRGVREGGGEIAAGVLWEGTLGPRQSNERHDLESDFIARLCLDEQCDLNVQLTPVGHANSLATNGKKVFSESKRLRRELDELRAEFAEYRRKYPATCNTACNVHPTLRCEDPDICNATHHPLGGVLHVAKGSAEFRAEFAEFSELA